MKLKTLSEQVYDYLFDKIKSGEIPIGERVFEKDLCEELGTSRTPVREAMIRLAADGILDNVPQKGFYVKTFDREHLRLEMEIIGRLDALAAERACTRLTEDQWSQMEQLIEEMDRAIDGRDGETYSRSQVAFHEIYRSHCGNRPLRDLLISLSREGWRPYTLTTDEDALFERFRHSNAEHKQVLDAMRREDMAAIDRILQKHWDVVYADIMI